MSDRPAPTSPPPSSPPPAARPDQQARSPKPSRPPQAPPPQQAKQQRPSSKPPKPPKAPQPQENGASRPGAAPRAAGAAAAPGMHDTAARVGLAERIQAKLSGKGSESDAVTPAPTGVPRDKARTPRRARLRLTRIDPWSVMKAAFLLSIAFGIVTVVAVAMIWQVIGAAGVWTSINDTVKEVINEPGTADFDIQDYVGTERVLGFTMLVAAVDVVLITAIATLGAFLYNMSAALLGGIELTMAED